MDVEYPRFGTIVVEGTTYDHDIVVEDGVVRARSKKPSKPFRGQFGHTPLSADEDIPWSKPRLVVGTGFSARLPIMTEVYDRARDAGVELVTLPTAEACALLNTMAPGDINAVLHVTC
jgi:hypothetical protein